MLPVFPGGSRRWFIVKIALTALFVFLGAAYLATHWEEFSNLHRPSGFAVLAVTSAFVCNLWLASWFNAIVARKLDANIPGLDSFAISTVTSAVNFVLPLRAGAAMRALYMKRQYNLPYSRFASTLAIFYLANLLVAAMAAMACVGIVYRDTADFKADLFLLLPSLLIAAGAFLVWHRRQPTRECSHASPWHDFAGGFSIILSDRRTALYALVVVFLGMLVSTFGWTVALRDYAPDVSIAEAILIVVSQIIGGLVTVTAGSAGFQELAGIYVGNRLGMTIVEIFAVLIWTKVARMLVAFLLSVPSAVLLRNRLKSVPLRVS